MKSADAPQTTAAETNAETANDPGEPPAVAATESPPTRAQLRAKGSLTVPRVRRIRTALARTFHTRRHTRLQLRRSRNAAQ